MCVCGPRARFKLNFGDCFLSQKREGEKNKGEGDKTERSCQGHKQYSQRHTFCIITKGEVVYGCYASCAPRGVERTNHECEHSFSLTIGYDSGGRENHVS